MRVSVPLPSDFPFVTEVPVYISHINYGGHLDNALLLTLVSEARLRFLKSMGFTELDVDGVGIIVADAAVQYRAEAFHGDLLEVRMGAGNLGRKGCDLIWQMADHKTGHEVARGKTGIVFFDYAARQVVEMPAAFRRAVSARSPEPHACAA